MPFCGQQQEREQWHLFCASTLQSEGSALQNNSLFYKKEKKKKSKQDAVQVDSYRNERKNIRR